MMSVATLLRALVLGELAVAIALAWWLGAARDWPVAAATLGGLAVAPAAHALVVAVNFVVASISGSPTPSSRR